MQDTSQTRLHSWPCLSLPLCLDGGLTLLGAGAGSLCGERCGRDCGFWVAQSMPGIAGQLPWPWQEQRPPCRWQAVVVIRLHVQRMGTEEEGVGRRKEGRGGGRASSFSDQLWHDVTARHSTPSLLNCSPHCLGVSSLPSHSWLLGALHCANGQYMCSVCGFL